MNAEIRHIYDEMNIFAFDYAMQIAFTFRLNTDVISGMYVKISATARKLGIQLPGSLVALC